MADEKILDSDKQDINVLTVSDKGYPKWFKDLTNPPKLYAKGNIELLSQDGIAIIGTRHPSATTKTEGPGVILKIIEKLGKDTPIVSGLALGCDEIAHETALEYDIPTIAVLPSGFDAISPKSHEHLAQDIIDSGGCLLSEYAPSTEARKYTYIERDKLIAALVPGILVLECGVTSGTLHTVQAGASKRMKRILGVCSNAYDGNRLILERMGGHDIATPDGLNNYIVCLLNKVAESAHEKKIQPTLADFGN